ncbi:MAG TPA: 30S ribosomal protein S8 [Candidatus Lokiarchaeia archaeon]|nr:30S ribosomal protein S8 [Candidatus Lokiarchaeia archaeon]
MLLDPLANALTVINNAEKARSKNYVYLHPASKLIGKVLSVMMQRGYIGVVEFIDDGASGTYKVELLGHINKCQSIKPRYAVKKQEIETWETEFLPSKGFGFLILSTNMGIMTNEDAKQKGIGGRLLAFIY